LQKQLFLCGLILAIRRASSKGYSIKGSPTDDAVPFYEALGAEIIGSGIYDRKIYLSPQKVKDAAELFQNLKARSILDNFEWNFGLLMGNINNEFGKEILLNSPQKSLIDLAKYRRKVLRKGIEVEFESDELSGDLLNAIKVDLKQTNGVKSIKSVFSYYEEWLKGGKGSGNFNHAGRIGKVGGSSVTGITIDSLMQKAKKNEKEITSILKKTKGKMVGLEHRFKSKESLLRKVTSDVEEKGISQSEALNDINDVLRYTKILPAETFLSDVVSIQNELESADWVQWDTKWKNYFRSGDAYDGYNTVLVNKNNGVRFELQFHTEETINIKNKNHILYEQFRIEKNHNVRKELFLRMQNNWKNYDKPKNWQNLPGVIQ